MVRSFLAILAAWVAAGAARAHHVMEYATPATALDGFLSGIGHPVIGFDHLLFVIGAGVLAARVERGFLLPLVFVAASACGVLLRVAGAGEGVSEFWVAGSLVVLGGLLLVAAKPARGLVAALFAAAGAIHGYALAEGIVGAEATPLVAYLCGLTLTLWAIAACAWAATVSSYRYRPGLPLARLGGAALGVAGLLFVANALL